MERDIAWQAVMPAVERAGGGYGHARKIATLTRSFGAGWPAQGDGPAWKPLIPHGQSHGRGASLNLQIYTGPGKGGDMIMTPACRVFYLPHLRRPISGVVIFGF
jgi:hypothetical protein